MNAASDSAALVVQPTSEAEIVQGVSRATRVRVFAGGTKPGPRRGEAFDVELDLSRWSGVLEYESTEYTLTAKSGTPLSEIAATLAANGQYLPFDPPFVNQGATLGGALASGLSGPGRLRYGGIRDFVLGLRLVDGTGTVVRGGGKVVKNAAGFDLPKLLVGSCGSLGVVLEWTVKVFPHPPARRSLVARFSSIELAMQAVVRLTQRPFDLDAVDLAAAGSVEGSDAPIELRMRLAGEAESIERQSRAMREVVGTDLAWLEADEANVWDDWVNASWHEPTGTLLRIPTTVHTAPEIIRAARAEGWRWRCMAAGQGTWLSVPRDVAKKTVESILKPQGMEALVVSTQGELGGRWGVRRSGAFAQRIKQAVDPQRRFGDF